MNREDGGRSMPERGGYPALQDLAGLWLAESAPELWERLVWTGGLGPSANHWDAAGLFRKFHGQGQPGAMDTALLLCTDDRWANATGRMIAEIAASGILTDDQLVRLAERFLEDPLRWRIPDELTRGPWVEIVLDEHAEAEAEEDAVAEDASAEPAGSPDQPIWMARMVKPPLRRWAAATILRQDAARLGPLLARADNLSARDAAFVIAGVIDARDSFDERGAARLIELGLSWPASWVRLLALQLVADRDGFEVAQPRAAGDPSAKVRAWAERLQPVAGGMRTPRARRPSGAHPPASPDGAGRSKTESRPPSPQPEPADQPSLFEVEPDAGEP
jgi:hypothetical protein